MDRILIVRLGSLGDIVHAIPAAVALRETFPEARLDWVVDERHREILDLLPFLDRRLVLQTQSRSPWRSIPVLVRELRRTAYDVALDLQGLLKSAVLARASGARRVVGFSAAHLRERTARPFYTEVYDASGATHVAEKNLALACAVGARASGLRFPLVVPRSAAADEVRRRLQIAGAGRFAIVNPGGGWPNKRWPAERFGQLARHLQGRHGLKSAVTWGPGEEGLARQVAEASGAAAAPAPPTSVADLAALAQVAALVVSGDTGPLHLAAALGTPVVGIYGPTDPRRNGPWADADVTVSRFDRCRCHHRRRCRAASWCLDDISVQEVSAAVDLRLAALSAARS